MVHHSLDDKQTIRAVFQCYFCESMFSLVFLTWPQTAMGRMYGPGKGMRSSVLHYRRAAQTAPEVEEQIVRAAKKGMLSSQIGSLLRDVHGVPLVHGITGGKVLRLLRARGLAPEVPEDLYFLNKKAVAIRKHLDRNRTDVDAKFRLILIESRVHRLVRYYRRAKKIPASWKFESTAASTLVA
jgi:small subunit ribosomal protein S13e